jgi:putative endonuclease
MIFRALDRIRHRWRLKHWSHRRAIGRYGEDLAHRYLQTQGMKIVSRNYTLANGSGEADIIAWEKSILVFIEVKTRTSAEFGPPDRAIGADKRRNMRRVARAYSLKCSMPWSAVRFDTVNVVLGDPVQIEHIAGSVESGLWKQSAGV